VEVEFAARGGADLGCEVVEVAGGLEFDFAVFGLHVAGGFVCLFVRVDARRAVFLLTGARAGFADESFRRDSAVRVM
jgi:hypothetical protein